MTLAFAKARTGMQNAPERTGGRGFRLSKQAKKEKTRPGKKLEKGVENPFFI